MRSQRSASAEEAGLSLTAAAPTHRRAAGPPLRLALLLSLSLALALAAAYLGAQRALLQTRRPRSPSPSLWGAAWRSATPPRATQAAAPLGPQAAQDLPRALASPLLAPTPTPAAIPRLLHTNYLAGARQLEADSRGDRTHFRRGRQGRTHNPDWQHVLWDRHAAIELLETRYPWFLPTWLAYPTLVMQSDALRPFVLHAHGGVYLDLDTECFRPLGPSLQGVSLALMAEEPGLVNNAQMGSAPGHPLWGLAAAAQGVSDPLYATGPRVVTAALRELASKPDGPLPGRYDLPCGGSDPMPHQPGAATATRKGDLLGGSVSSGSHADGGGPGGTAQHFCTAPAVVYGPREWFSPCAWNDGACHTAVSRIAPLLRQPPAEAARGAALLAATAAAAPSAPLGSRCGLGLGSLGNSSGGGAEGRGVDLSQLQERQASTLEEPRAEPGAAAGQGSGGRGWDSGAGLLGWPGAPLVGVHHFSGSWLGYDGSKAERSRAAVAEGLTAFFTDPRVFVEADLDRDLPYGASAPPSPAAGDSAGAGLAAAGRGQHVPAEAETQTPHAPYAVARFAAAWLSAGAGAAAAERMQGRQRESGAGFGKGLPLNAHRVAPAARAAERAAGAEHGERCRVLSVQGRGGGGGAAGPGGALEAALAEALGCHARVVELAGGQEGQVGSSSAEVQAEARVPAGAAAAEQTTSVAAAAAASESEVTAIGLAAGGSTDVLASASGGGSGQHGPVEAHRRLLPPAPPGSWPSLTTGQPHPANAAGPAVTEGVPAGAAAAAGVAVAWPLAALLREELAAALGEDPSGAGDHGQVGGSPGERGEEVPWVDLLLLRCGDCAWRLAREVYASGWDVHLSRVRSIIVADTAPLRYGSSTSSARDAAQDDASVVLYELYAVLYQMQGFVGFLHLGSGGPGGRAGGGGDGGAGACEALPGGLTLGWLRPPHGGG
ncbi:hypothetical protein HYH03_007405 [Edaphochlamys debaryana]|uniref:Uncharacterized protein n=1 Tax=Edaphochlamys debaryana TaxID=47281 RepID=A0A835Y439_9CHLO|nr:hypothetical protein HYH03_007405 [Edaphochlamys debaryana]|eukprot:KAG2494348.1 hypothetical protein HYH03_007405 [Edaphochlamys debaryana]